jgi:transposase
VGGEGDVIAPPSDDVSREDLRELVMKALTMVEEQQKTIAEQAQRIAELEAKLKKDSGNSSKPPSSDAPRPKRRRGRRPASGKKQGGHRATRARDATCSTRAPWMRSMTTRDRVPVLRRQRPRAGRAAAGPTPGRRRPALLAETTEHRRHRGRCRTCGSMVLAPLPTSVLRSNFGPRLQALVAQLTGVFRLSRREAARFCEDAFGV